jgi:hypothetical protein
MKIKMRKKIKDKRSWDYYEHPNKGIVLSRKSRDLSSSNNPARNRKKGGGGGRSCIGFYIRKARDYSANFHRCIEWVLSCVQATFSGK